MSGLTGFFERGWVRLTGAFDSSGLAEALWRELSAHGPQPDDPVTWQQAGGWHPALFHAAAPNTARHPRFMLTHTALRRAR